MNDSDSDKIFGIPKSLVKNIGEIFMNENDSDKIFGIPKSLVKNIVGLVVFFIITNLLSSQVCIFSTCTTPGLMTPELLIGGAVTLLLMTMFPVALAPALMSGLGVWFLLQNLGWLHML